MSANTAGTKLKESDSGVWQLLMQSDTQQDCACHHQIPQLKSLMSTDEQRTLNANDERDDRTLEQPTPSCEAGIAFRGACGEGVRDHG